MIDKVPVPLQQYNFIMLMSRQSLGEAQSVSF